VSDASALADANVAVVVVNYRTPQLTLRCLAALGGERRALPKLRVVVVDGGSPDNSATDLAEAIGDCEYRDWVTFLPLPVNGGFGWANNQAILTLAAEREPPEFIHFLNPDAEVREGAVVALVRELQQYPRCAAVGSQLLMVDGGPVASAFAFPSAGHEFVNASQSEALGRLASVGPRTFESSVSIEVDWVTGASFMVRSAALRESGLFDDGFFLYFDEVELMHRIRGAGWTVRHVPGSRVVHAEGSSTGIDAVSGRPHPPYWYQSRRRYFARTGGSAGVTAANCAWLAGSAIALLMKAVGRAAANPTRTSDIFRAGLWPRGSDSRPSFPRWGDSPGKPPAWMPRH
jgi:N-acetylglucosaminyl-diphospho-decaprenol L-rhamnosyltransferase